MGSVHLGKPGPHDCFTHDEIPGTMVVAGSDSGGAGTPDGVVARLACQLVMVDQNLYCCLASLRDVVFVSVEDS